MTENNNCGHTFTNGLTYLLIGGGIGAGLALLFAPKSGTALRSDIADVTRKGYDATVEKATALKDQSAAAVTAVKEKAEAVYDFASAKISAGTDAINNAAASATGAVVDGIEKIQDEAEQVSKQMGNGRKSTSIV
ncbi:MAG TPA: YtxH domain-containing protein [Pyrinomonadaceae bacterium]|nr:YtxH domain-containing protein [Pyrinomonadaceae bacterium]